MRKESAEASRIRVNASPGAIVGRRRTKTTSHGITLDDTTHQVHA